MKFLGILTSIPVTDLKKAFIYVVLDAKWTNVYMLTVDWLGITHYLNHRPEHNQGKSLIERLDNETMNFHIRRVEIFDTRNLSKFRSTLKIQQKIQNEMINPICKLKNTNFHAKINLYQNFNKQRARRNPGKRKEEKGKRGEMACLTESCCAS